jgi:branched-chain amino acid transport system permease protein
MIFDAATLGQFVISGLSVGCIYGLVGIGFAVIYNASGIVNFAQGSFVMLGGIVTYALYSLAHLPLLAAVLLAPVLVGAIGLLMEWSVIRPLWRRQAPILILILATLAVQVLLENATLHAVGTDPHSFPPFSSGDPIRVGRISVAAQSLWIVGCSLALVAVLRLFYTRTLTGKAMRACAVNRDVASLLGIPVERMLAYAFVLSAALGAAGGVLITPTQYTAFHVALPFGISGFVAAIIGGFGNAGGAFVGGLVLGVTESLAVAFIASGYKEVVTFTLLLIILLVRPTGLFGSLVEE